MCNFIMNDFTTNVIGANNFSNCIKLFTTNVERYNLQIYKWNLLTYTPVQCIKFKCNILFYTFCINVSTYLLFLNIYTCIICMYLGRTKFQNELLIDELNAIIFCVVSCEKQYIHNVCNLQLFIRIDLSIKVSFIGIDIVLLSRFNIFRNVLFQSS